MDYSHFNPVAQQQHQQQQQQQQQPPYQVFPWHPAAASPAHPKDANDSAMSARPYEYNNNYASFHGSYFPTSGGVITRPPQPQPQPQPQPPQQPRRQSQHTPPETSNSIDMTQTDDLGQYVYTDFIDDPLASAQPFARSSSEEKDLITPAQDRRKAQNRAAQRAFRERKEKRVRELEQKLTDLQAQSMTLHADNERLKRELAKVATENEILRATSTTGGDGGGDHNAKAVANLESATATINGPKKFVSLDVRKSYANSYKTNNKNNNNHNIGNINKNISNNNHNHNHNNNNSLPTQRVILSPETGDRLLNTKATWDLIQSHPLFKQGLVDIGYVCERLKEFTKCDGAGPAFEEGRVTKLIEESAASGSDELI